MSEVKIQKVAQTEDRSLPVFSELDQFLQRIRARAFDIFSGRDRAQGHAIDDWLAAERELCGAAGELVERDSEFLLNVALAGFAAKEVAVTATPRELIVRACSSNEAKSEPGGHDGTVRWSEFRSNDLYRRVALPEDIDVDQVTATFRNGLLSIVAAKAEAAARLPVKVDVATQPAAAVPLPAKPAAVETPHRSAAAA